jgi:hypothetical protein
VLKRLIVVSFVLAFLAAARVFLRGRADWGAPRIHGELQKLGFVVSERTMARYLRRIQRRGDPERVTCDCSQPPRSHHRFRPVHRAYGDVPGVVLLFVIEHARHRILHFNVTRHPSANWVVQQLRTGPASPSLPGLVEKLRDSGETDNSVARRSLQSSQPPEPASSRQRHWCSVGIELSEFREDH